MGTDLLLLPDTYAASTDPQLLHSILTSTSATLKGSAGFSNSSAQVSLYQSLLGFNLVLLSILPPITLAQPITYCSPQLLMLQI